MAATATITVDFSTDIGVKRGIGVTVAVTSYQSSGITFTPALVGLSYIDRVFMTVSGAQSANNPVIIDWDGANNLLLAYKASNSASDNGNAFTLKGLVIGS